jgi:hypothetical protein
MKVFSNKIKGALSILSGTILLSTGITFAQIQNFSAARMVEGSTTEQVLDMTISLHRTWASLTPALRAQYEEVIQNWADGVYEMSNGGHLLGKIRIFSDSRFNNAADVVWTAALRPNANCNGFLTSSGTHINFADTYNTTTIPGTARQLQESGYGLAHETGHYVYSFGDEYPIQLGDVAVPNAIMNQQTNAVGGNFQWLNLSTPGNIGNVAQSDQGQMYGMSCWESALQNPALDPLTATRWWNGTRRQYSVLNGRAPTAASTWSTFSWMSVELPVARARDSLVIIWMGNSIDIDLVLDKSGSMSGQPIQDVQTASKAFVDAVLNFSTTMQLTPSIGLTAFSSTPENPATYPITTLTSANIGTVKGLIDAMTASGTTAMYDACLLSNTKLTGYSSSSSTRLCMLLTDGEDNSSVVTNPALVVAPFVSDNIPIYTFGYGSGASHINCTELADGTNGTFYANLTDMNTITDEWLRIFDNAADIQYAKDAAFSTATGLDFVIDPTVSALVVQVTYKLASASSYCTFTIRDNNDVLIPSTVHTIPLGSTYPREEIALISVNSGAISGGVSGNWKCMTNASGLVSTDLQGKVKLKGTQEGTFSLAVTDIGKGHYTYPQPLHLVAALGKGRTISGLNVVAKLTSPSGTVSNIAMYDDGTNGDQMASDGQYTALYSSYTENGQFIFTVNVDNGAATGYYTIAGVKHAQGGTAPAIVPVTDNFARVGRTVIHITGVTPTPPVIEQLMGFEDASLWQFIMGTSGTLSNVAVSTSGTSSLNVSGGGWQQIKSTDINTQDLPTVTNALAIDLFVGDIQPNPNWIGQAQFHINCPSAGINNQHVGSAELTGLTLNQFHTLSFNLPTNIVNVMNGNYTDLSISFSLNTNSGSGPYYFDTMRFIP